MLAVMRSARASLKGTHNEKCTWQSLEGFVGSGVRPELGQQVRASQLEVA